MYATEGWDKASSSWNGIIKFLFNYIPGPNGDLTADNTQQIWDAANSKWINGQKIINFYNSTGVIDTQITQKWDASNSLWKIANWKKECIALALPCFSIPEQGAFVLDIKE